MSSSNWTLPGDAAVTRSFVVSLASNKTQDHVGMTFGSYPIKESWFQPRPRSERLPDLRLVSISDWFTAGGYDHPTERTNFRAVMFTQCEMVRWRKKGPVVENYRRDGDFDCQ